MSNCAVPRCFTWLLGLPLGLTQTSVLRYFTCCVLHLLLLQAIESFAVTVKDIAQMLQSFGTELAETELPSEGKAIEHLLDSHTDKYRKLKVMFIYTYDAFNNTTTVIFDQPALRYF